MEAAVRTLLAEPSPAGWTSADAATRERLEGLVERIGGTRFDHVRSLPAEQRARVRQVLMELGSSTLRRSVRIALGADAGEETSANTAGS